MSLIRNVNVQQNVVTSEGNCSTTNLSAGNSYSFTGTAASTLGVVGIQVSLKTDQNCTVYVDQSPDGTNWDIVDAFNFYASIGNFGTTVQAINSYVRVRVVSNSLTTTYFRLQTVLCPIVECVPRSLDENGHLQTAIHSMRDTYGFEVENTPQGEMRTVVPVRLVGATYEGTTVDNNFWLATTANAATIAQANGQIVLTSGVNAAGSAQLNSVRRARYVSGSSIRFRAIVVLSAGIADNVRKWGVAFGTTMPTITDGAYFKLDGETLKIVTFRGGSETEVASGSFNGVAGASFAPGTATVTYEIYWTNAKVWFVVNGELLHTVSATATTWSTTTSHHIYLSNINAGNTTSVDLTCRVASIERLGSLLTQPISKYQSGTTAGVVLKYSAGNLHGITISGVSNNSVITLYDNTSAAGTVIWTSGAMGALTTPFGINFWGIPFYFGLTLVIAAANSTVTVAYE